MKELLANLWHGKAGTTAAGLSVFLGVYIAADLDWPKWVMVTLAAFAALFGSIAGPSKPKP